MSKKNATPVSAVEMSATLDINQVIAETGLSSVYIRRAISTGKLIAHKEPVKEGATTVKNVITRADFEAWRAQSASHTQREDGRNKFVLYMTQEEAEKLQVMIAGEPFAELLSRANVKPAPEAEA